MQIIVEDLFYNVLIRRKVLKSFGEEYVKIVDVVSKYVIYNFGIVFILKKQGENMVDVRIVSGVLILDNICVIYGVIVVRELLEVSCDNQRYVFKMYGYIFNVNYFVKKLQFLLFINYWFVDFLLMRKVIELLYEVYILKNSYLFVYLLFEIVFSNVDVNVYFIKYEVYFLYEDCIIEVI